MTGYVQLHWKRAAILGACLLAVVLVVLFWRELALAGAAWLGWRRLYGGKRRKHRGRPGRATVALLTALGALAVALRRRPAVQMSAPARPKVPSSIRANGVTYRNPADAYAAAELIEYEAEQRADPYRRDGSEGLADRTIDRGREQAERLREWARLADDASVSPGDGPGGRARR